MNNYDLGQKYGEPFWDNDGIPLRPGTPEYNEAFKQRYSNLPSSAFTGQATPVQPTLNFAPGWDPASIRGLAWTVKGLANQAKLDKIQKQKEADINRYNQLQIQTLGDPDLLQQYEAEDLARLNQPVEYLPNIDREYKWKPNTGEAITTPTVTTPNTTTTTLPNSTPAPTKPTYLSYSDYFANKDPTFTKWYGDYGNNFKDPKAAVDWFRLNGSKPYTEQPGFFSQLGQGLLDNFTSNPLGFAGGLFNLYQGFKQAGYMKDYYNTQKDLYNTQKNIMLNNERRNQEQWNMLKRQRASSSL